MLPIYFSQSREMSAMQTAWASMLNPMIENPITQGLFLPNVELSMGANSIDHRLGHKVRGWIVVRKRSAADIYDMEASNTMPTLKLNLNASAAVSVDLYVF